jgi:hypothetical protein
MLSAVRRVLDHQMTIAEWMGTALLLSVPHLGIGVVWSLTHTGHLSQLDGPAKVVSFLAAVIAWPALLFADGCST